MICVMSQAIGYNMIEMERQNTDGAWFLTTVVVTYQGMGGVINGVWCECQEF